MGVEKKMSEQLDKIFNEISDMNKTLSSMDTDIKVIKKRGCEAGMTELSGLKSDIKVHKSIFYGGYAIVVTAFGVFKFWK